MDTGPALSSFIANTLGITVVTMFYTVDDAYTESLAQSFTSAYAGQGNKILLSYPFNSNKPDYEDMMHSIELTGAPAVVVFFQPAHLESFFAHVSTVRDPEIYIYFTSELFGVNKSCVPKGTAGTSLSKPYTSEYQRFIGLWKSLDPVAYEDRDGDRELVGIQSRFVFLYSFFLIGKLLQHRALLNEPGRRGVRAGAGAGGKWERHR